MFRNAVFSDLVVNDWPVVKDGEIISYYIGFWLPPALLAKLTGSIYAGWIGQTLYGTLGILLGLLLIFDAIGKVKYRVLLILIFAGTLDIVENILAHRGYIEINWNKLAFLEWTGVGIFWIYNQVIMSFLGCMLFFKLKSPLFSALILAFLLLCAPLSVVGLFPMSLFNIYKGAKNTSGIKDKLSIVFSPENIMSLLIAVVIGSYLRNNINAGHFGIVPVENFGSYINLFKEAFFVFFLGLMVWIPIVWQRVKKDPEFWILLSTYLPCMFLSMNGGPDFAARTVLPLSFYLTIQLSFFICNDWKIRPLWQKIYFTAIILLSSASPVYHFKNVISSTIHSEQETWRNPDLKSIFHPSRHRNNFIGDEEGWVFRKKREGE